MISYSKFVRPVTKWDDTRLVACFPLENFGGTLVNNVHFSRLCMDSHQTVIAQSSDFFVRFASHNGTIFSRQSSVESERYCHIPRTYVSMIEPRRLVSIRVSAFLSALEDTPSAKNKIRPRARPRARGRSKFRLFSPSKLQKRTYLLHFVSKLFLNSYFFVDEATNLRDGTSS